MGLEPCLKALTIPHKPPQLWPDQLGFGTPALGTNVVMLALGAVTAFFLRAASGGRNQRGFHLRFLPCGTEAVGITTTCPSLFFRSGCFSRVFSNDVTFLDVRREIYERVVLIKDEGKVKFDCCQGHLVMNAFEKYYKSCSAS